MSDITRDAARRMPASSLANALRTIALIPGSYSQGSTAVILQEAAGRIDPDPAIPSSPQEQPVAPEPGKLSWHEGTHAWESHGNYPRHQHSLNGVLTIAPDDTQVHFSHGPAFT